MPFRYIDKATGTYCAPPDPVALATALGMLTEVRKRLGDSAFATAAAEAVQATDAVQGAGSTSNTLALIV